MNWKNIKIKGISEIERFVTELRLFSCVFPYAYCNFRIYEKQNGQFICRSEIAVYNKLTSNHDKILCEGTSQEMAFDTTVKKLFNKIAENIVDLTPKTLIHAEANCPLVYLKNHEF